MAGRTSRDDGDQPEIGWGIASGLLFLVAATFFAAAVTVDGDASGICVGFGVVFGVLAIVAMYVTLAAYFGFWPY